MIKIIEHESGKILHLFNKNTDKLPVSLDNNNNLLINPDPPVGFIRVKEYGGLSMKVAGIVHSAKTNILCLRVTLPKVY